MASIRPFAPSEWQTVRSFRLDALKNTPGAFALSHDVVAQWPETVWREEIRGATQQIFGLFDGDELIGITAVFTWRGDATGQTALLAMSYIRPQWRGRGLSRMFYDARFDWIRARPIFRRVIVSHRASNEASKRANQKHGFVQTERVAYEWPDGVTEDEVMYELSLSPSDPRK
jgi:RimJ/RimL family protein N-acetyltransferase